jgi:Tol biopolymer transport system component
MPAAGPAAEAVPAITLEMEKTREVTPQDDYMAPRWSKDGLDILASKGKYNGLYLISADGSDVRQISDEPGVGYHASWSPDGNYVVVEEEDRTRYFDRSGDEVDADLVGPQARPPVYAKDGIVYRQAGASRSESDEAVIAEGDNYFEPVASPDGTKVAYIGLESGIIIKDLRTQEDVIIGEGTDLCWLPDSSGIVFNYTQDDGRQIVDGEIFYASADGGEAQNLTDTPDLIERRPDLSGDGSQLTYEVDGQIFSVDVVLH